MYDLKDKRLILKSKKRQIIELQESFFSLQKLRKPVSDEEKRLNSRAYSLRNMIFRGNREKKSYSNNKIEEAS